MNCLKNGALGFALLFFTVSSAWAGITADFTLLNYKNAKQDRISKGKYFYTDKKFFVEHQIQMPPVKKGSTAKVKEQPMKQTFYVDTAQSKATMLLHKQKRFMELDLSQPRQWEQGFWNRFMSQGGIPVNVEEFKKRRYEVKMVREEKFQGHPCKVWKAEKSLGGQTQIVNIWTAKDLDDVPVKVIVNEGTEKKSEMTLSRLKKATVEPSIFSHPSDYTPYQPKIMTGGMPKDAKPLGKGKVKATTPAKQKKN